MIVCLNFFVYQTVKMLMVLTLVMFLSGILRSFLSPDRVRRILAGRGEISGGILASILGIITPFCNCSAIPLFIGFVEAGVPLGVTFSFLIAAPMINEVALTMLFAMFGLKIAALYAVSGFLIAVTTGWIVRVLKMERFVEDWVTEIQMSRVTSPEPVMTWKDRGRFGLLTARDTLRRVWLYVVAGIGVGALIHGFMPEGLLASLLGKGTWWSVPAAILIGVPMYSNAAGIIPIVQALMEKGAALGTVLAFMMSVIGLSLPEVIILRKVLKPQLIVLFVGVVSVGIFLVGLLFNIV